MDPRQVRGIPQPIDGVPGQLGGHSGGWDIDSGKINLN